MAVYAAMIEAMDANIARLTGGRERIYDGTDDVGYELAGHGTLFQGE